MAKQIEYQKIKSMHLFENLNLTNDEIDEHYIIIKKIINQQNLCSKNNIDQCPIGGYHQMLIRNKCNNLEVITMKCNNLKPNIKFITSNNYIYANININKHNQFLKKADIIVNQNDVHRIKLINFLLELKKTSTLNSFFVYGDIDTGKTFITMAYCNEFALLNKSIVVINLPSFVMNISESLNDKSLINDIIDKINSCEILFLDEIGNEPFHKFVHLNIIYPTLIQRIEKNLTTIFTSNYSINDLGRKYTLDKYVKNNLSDIKLIINKIKKIVGKNIYKLEEKYAI